MERIKVSVRPAGPRRQPRRRPSGAQDTAARRKWVPRGRAGRAPGPRVLASRAWMRDGSRQDPRASAGGPTGASGGAACPWDRVRGLRGRARSRLATRWRPGLGRPGCGRMLLREGREATEGTDAGEMDAGEDARPSSAAPATLGDRKGELRKSPRQPQSSSSTAYRMHARTPCCSACQPEATPSGSPGPVLYCEDWQAARREPGARGDG